MSYSFFTGQTFGVNVSSGWNYVVPSSESITFNGNGSSANVLLSNSSGTLLSSEAIETNEFILSGATPISLLNSSGNIEISGGIELAGTTPIVFQNISGILISANNGTGIALGEQTSVNDAAQHFTVEAQGAIFYAFSTNGANWALYGGTGTAGGNATSVTSWDVMMSGSNQSGNDYLSVATADFYVNNLVLQTASSTTNYVEWLSTYNGGTSEWQIYSTLTINGPWNLVFDAPNVLAGSTPTITMNTSSLTVTGKVVYNNLVNSQTSGGAITSITVGASPFSYENTLGYDVIVIVSGGAGLTETFNGTTIASGITGTVHNYILRPNDTLEITYTTAPSMFYYPL